MDLNQAIVRPVNGDNWRAVAKLTVTEAQREFVADPCYYLALCCYGAIWHPLAVSMDERVIGFLMWGLDTADGSCWLGGLLIDQAYQRQGYGRQAIQAAIAMLAKEQGHQQFPITRNCAPRSWLAIARSALSQRNTKPIWRRSSLCGGFN